MKLKENINNAEVLHPTELAIRKEKGDIVFTFLAKKSSLFSSGANYNDPIYNGCVVEVFLFYGKKNHYYEFEVAPNGTIFLADIENINNKTHIHFIDNCFIKTNVEINGDEYRVTMKIPLTKIKTESPKFNAFRIETLGNKQYLYALNPTMCETFHKMEAFIDLLPLL